MTKSLLEAGVDDKHVVWGHVLSTAAGVASTTGSLFASVLEYFLKGPEDVLKFVNGLAKQDSEKAFEQLQHYVQEAARLSCETSVYRSVATATTIADGDIKIDLKAGDRVLLNLRSACLDPNAYKDPTKFDPTRPLQSYLHLGMGPHKNLGVETTWVALTAMCKAVLRLDGLKGAAGPQGKVQKVVRPLPGGARGVQYHGFLTENWDSVWPAAQSLKVNWT